MTFNVELIILFLTGTLAITLGLWDAIAPKPDQLKKYSRKEVFLLQLPFITSKILKKEDQKLLKSYILIVRIQFFATVSFFALLSFFSVQQSASIGEKLNVLDETSRKVLERTEKQ